MAAPDGLQIMQENMAALEAGEDAPHNEDTVYDEPKPDEPEAEVVDEVIDDVVDDDIVGESDESGISEISKKDGYMTKEQWVESGKNPEDYMTEKEFSKVGELRDGDMTRQQLSKQNVQMESLMNEVLTNQNKMIDDAKASEREKVIAELKAEQKEAIEFQDADKALEIERKIVAEEEESKPKVEVKDDPDPEPQAPPGMVDWHNNNKHWYNVDLNAQTLINSELTKSQAKGVSFEDGIITAEAKVRKYYPQYFDDDPEAKPETKPNRPRPAGESSRRKGPATVKKSFKDLDPVMQSFAKKAAKASGMTEEQYMESM